MHTEDITAALDDSPGEVYHGASGDVVRDWRVLLTLRDPASPYPAEILASQSDGWVADGGPQHYIDEYAAGGE